MSTYQRFLAGFTLLELMISLAIGSIVTGTGLTLYVQISKSRNLIQAELNLQSNGYFIHQTLRQLFHQAGFRPLNKSNLPTAVLPVKTAEQSFAAEVGKYAEGEFVRLHDEGVAFRFEGSSDAMGVADGSMINCQGDSISAGVVQEIDFSVEDEGLLCKSDGVTVELIGVNDDVRVEQMVIKWGVDTDNNLSVDEYRAASTPIAANEVLMSIRLSLLLSSADEVHSGNVGYRFDGIEYVSTDSRLRHESTTTIQLRH